MAITTTQVVQEYGAYYIDAGQNKKRILQQLSQGREIVNFATPIKTDDTIFRLANATFQSLVQPFQKAFTQKGGVAIVPKEIRQYRFKIDDEFMPDELYATWLGFLTANNVNRKDWPFVKWLVENYYKNQIDQDMELNEYYNGVYAAPEAGTAGANGTSMVGVKKLLQDGVDAGTMNYVDIEALDPSTIFDQVELFTDSIAEVYQGIKMNVFMSRKWYKKYMQDKRAQGFYQKTSDAQIDSRIDFTPLDVVPLASMVGTDDIFCTPKQNFLHISPATLTKNNFKMEEAKRAVAVMGDWSEGLGFGIDQIVWTNKAATGSASA
ncbi:hypothetical protein OU798_07485 [Prolixibacteraceae bacterium Z1-6]|uniref:Uncharacterized protein n=1 Tax=Draconibacterium aestuarii TaxID=2998507 RepID=A0A9X3J488_9BACT|nr:hypothetical protein [Prolixibacteraceae bacterium Z1-6]